VRLAPESVPTLVQLVALGDDVVAVQAGSVLAAIGLSEARAAARVGELLDDPEPRTRRRAAHLLAELASAGAEEAVLQRRLARAALEDSEWSVRAEAARSLGARASAGRESAAARAALEQALFDADPTVAAWAAEGLGALEDPRAVPALIAGLERGVRDGELALLAAVERALALASGERAPRDLAGWRRWWDEHRDSTAPAR
jgi:HEAT repeat protein